MGAVLLEGRGRPASAPRWALPSHSRGHTPTKPAQRFWPPRPPPAHFGQAAPHRRTVLPPPFQTVPRTHPSEARGLQFRHTAPPLPPTAPWRQGWAGDGRGWASPAPSPYPPPPPASPDAQRPGLQSAFTPPSSMSLFTRFHPLFPQGMDSEHCQGPWRVLRPRTDGPHAPHQRHDAVMPVCACTCPLWVRPHSVHVAHTPIRRVDPPPPHHCSRWFQPPAWPHGPTGPEPIRTHDHTMTWTGRSACNPPALVLLVLLSPTHRSEHPHISHHIIAQPTTDLQQQRRRPPITMLNGACCGPKHWSGCTVAPSCSLPYTPSHGSARPSESIRVALSHQQGYFAPPPPSLHQGLESRYPADLLDPMPPVVPASRGRKVPAHCLSAAERTSFTVCACAALLPATPPCPRLPKGSPLFPAWPHRTTPIARGTREGG